MRKASSLARAGRAAVCTLLAAGLLCGCSLLPGSGPDLPGSSTVVLNYDSSALEDGELRILYAAGGGSGNTLLCGGQVLYRASATEAVTLVPDQFTGETSCYLRTGSDPSADGGRCSALYDKSGAVIWTFEEDVNATLYGNLLVALYGYGYAYDSFASLSCRVIDLTSGQELPCPEGAVDCIPTENGLLFFTVYEKPAEIASPAEDPDPYSHCRVQVQDLEGNVLAQEEGSVSLLYDNYRSEYTNWIQMQRYAEDSGELLYTLYDPSTGRQIENYVYSCGRDAICVRTADGRYQVRRRDSDEVLGEYDDLCELYLPGVAVLWNSNRTGMGYFYEAHLEDGQVLRLKSISYGPEAAALYYQDGRLALYDSANGALLGELMIEPIEGQTYDSLTIASGSCPILTFYDEDFNTLAIRVYDSNGLLYDTSTLGTSYNYITDLAETEDGPVFAANYSGPGGASLYDVLDCRGNVLLHGLAEVCRAYGSFPPDCFVARRGFERGWMDHTGQWIYCESIFSSLESEDNPGYFW